MKNLLAPLALCLLVGACVPSTPQSRIEASPGKYDRLSGSHQTLVMQGKIDRGMGKDAVLLAWGSPNDTFDGERNGRRTERWDYSGSRPVYSTGFGFGSYYGYGGRYSPYGYGFGVGPEVSYIPYTRASVLFVNNRVDSWERAK